MPSASLGEGRRHVGIDVVHDALVAVPHQATDHVGAHPTQADHPELHGRHAMRRTAAGCGLTGQDRSLLASPSWPHRSTRPPSGPPSSTTGTVWPTPTCASSSPTTPTAATELVVEVGDLYLDWSKHRITRETIPLLVALAERGRRRGASGRHVPGRAHQPHRGPGRPPHRAPGAGRAHVIEVDGHERRPRRPRGPRPHGPVRRRGSLGRPHRGHGPAADQRRQHRHRRVRPRPGHGGDRPRRLRRPGPRPPLRVERRRRRPRPEAPRPRPGRDPGHRRLEDLHDPRDDDQRPIRPGVAGRRARRGRRPAPLRRPVDQRRRGRRLRHRRRRTCSASGTGSAAATRSTPPSASP